MWADILSANKLYNMTPVGLVMDSNAALCVNAKELVLWLPESVAWYIRRIAWLSYGCVWRSESGIIDAIEKGVARVPPFWAGVPYPRLILTLNNAITIDQLVDRK